VRWQALYDLARFSEQLDITTSWPKNEKELQLVYNLAYYVQPPKSVPMRLYLNDDIPVLLINEREAVYGTQLVQSPEEVENLRRTAEEVISRSREVGVFEHSDIWYEYCRYFRYYDARCL
jgi:hypothetical protein